MVRLSKNVKLSQRHDSECRRPARRGDSGNRPMPCGITISLDNNMWRAYLIIEMGPQPLFLTAFTDDTFYKRYNN
jgi:hypothetical protein